MEVLNGIFDCKETQLRYVFIKGRRIGMYHKDTCGSEMLANRNPYLKMEFGKYPAPPQKGKPVRMEKKGAEDDR